jgi:hypothetical protein
MRDGVQVGSGARVETAVRRVACVLTLAAAVLGTAALAVPALRIHAGPRPGDRFAAPSAGPALPGFPWALGPRRVGIQAGHWRIEQLPEELHRLQGSTGARFREYREVDLNLEVARRTAAILERAGVEVDLLPATVPPGYRADAFVAVHADGAARSAARGWKVASPWRSSSASRRLAEALAETYPSFTGLPEDRYGTTFNMRGYYAFSAHRFQHAISTDTPAVIIETGFVTVAEDRELLFGDPEAVARGIAAGIIRFLGAHLAFDREALAVVSYPAMRVARENVALRFHPDSAENSAAELEAGTLVRPLYAQDGWVEVVVWGDYRRFGWLPESSLEPLPGG